VGGHDCQRHAADGERQRLLAHLLDLPDRNLYGGTLMAASFKLSGLLRLLPSWTENSVTDSTRVEVRTTLANGTGAGQANAYWRDSLTITAGGTASIDLRSLPMDFFAATGSVGLASVKQLLVVNKSGAATLSVGGSVTNRWTALAAGAITLGPSGSVYASYTGTGYATTSSDKVLTITNNGAASATVEVYVAGVKT
jgi:hypothetical protein